MKKSILNVKGVEVISSNNQKKIRGGGSHGSLIDTTPLEPLNPEGPALPNWQWMCYSSGTASNNHIQYFKSETNLSLTDKRYICFKL